MDLSADHILVVFLLTTLAGLATGIGGFIAFFMKRTDTKTLTFALGLSGGVMVYISLVELLGEAQHRLMEFEGHTAGSWIAIASFFGGIAVAALIDYLVPEDENPHEARGPEDIHGQASGEFSSSRIKRSGILFALAIGIHNFPEGIATFAAGLDSLPGAGAEILDPGVRKAISPAKPSVEEWIQVMHEAHCLNLPTSATMMYGHVETSRQRVDHLLRIRDLQARCPEGHYGFLAFIPWIFRSSGTELERQGVATRFSPLEYIRIIAVSRLVLNNIRNIQASWLTVGKATAQVALHSGANDMGSIMIEENVVSSAGAHNQFDAAGIQQAIREAGFTPRLRDQLYRMR